MCLSGFRFQASIYIFFPEESEFEGPGGEETQCLKKISMIATPSYY